MIEPIITLAIPIFNAEPFIERSLRSALDQDFEFPYEVLIIDDCGTDRSMEIVSRLADQHPRGSTIRTIRHPENLGLGTARNTAIDEAHGKYLCFLDADDWLKTDCLSHLYALAEDSHADVAVGSTDQYEQGNNSHRYRLIDQVVRQEAAGVWMVAHNVFMNIEVWNKLMRLNFLRQHNIRTTHRIMEDSVLDFNLRVHAQTIALSSHVTLCYNIHQNSILGSLFGHHASDEAVSIYCDIIKQTQQLIHRYYHDIDGIYDLYGLRLFYTFHSFKRMQLSREQESYVKKALQGFLNFVPSMSCFHQGAFRLAYLACWLTGGNWRIYEQVYDRRFSRWAYYLNRLLRLI